MRRVTSVLMAGTLLLIYVQAAAAQNERNGYEELSGLVQAFMNGEQVGETFVVPAGGERLNPFGGEVGLSPGETEHATLTNTLDIVINPTGEPIFVDGFESGDVSAWSDRPIRIDRSDGTFTATEVGAPPTPAIPPFAPNNPFEAIDLLVDIFFPDDSQVIKIPPPNPAPLDGPVLIRGAQMGGPIPPDCGSNIIEFGTGAALNGFPMWEAPFAPNDLFLDTSHNWVTRCSDGSWEGELLVNQGDFFDLAPTGMYSVVSGNAFVQFIPASEMIDATGTRTWAFTTPFDNPYTPETVAFTAFPTFPSLAPGEDTLVIVENPWPSTVSPPADVHAPTSLSFTNGTCDPASYDSFFDIFFAIEVDGPVAVTQYQYDSGQRASGTATLADDGVTWTAQGSGEGYAETYDIGPGGTGTYTHTNSGTCTWDVSIDEADTIETELISLGLVGETPIGPVEVETGDTTASTGAMTTTSAASDQAATTEDGGGSFLWLIVIGVIILLSGFFLWWWPRRTSGGAGGGDDPRDTPPPRMYGEEIEHTKCDWALYFNDGGTRTALKEATAHECCVYDIEVKTTILAHEQAARGRQDAGDARLRMRDYGFAWTGLNLSAHASARSGPLGRLDWMQGYGDPTEQGDLASDDAYWQRGQGEEPPEVASHLGHKEETYLDVKLTAGCPEYENEYALKGDTSLQVLATQECTNDNGAPQCPVELTARGAFVGRISGDLWAQVGDAAGSDIDELEPVGRTLDEGDGGLSEIRARSYELSHAHRSDLAREKPTYEKAQDASDSDTISGDTAHLRVLSDTTADAGILVPVHVWPTTERVSAHVEGSLVHDVEIIGKMTAIDCESNGCQGHGTCNCTPSFKLKVSGSSALIEADGKRFPISRDPASSDRSSPPAPGPKYWRLA